MVMREMDQGSCSSEKEIDKVIMLIGKLSWRISGGFHWRDFLVRERGVINEVNWAFI